MNDKDKEAFEKWFYNYHFSPHYNRSGLEDAWQDACEYKQKEIDELTGQLKSCVFVYEEKVTRLLAENAKLRECVEKVAYNYDRPTDMMNSARQVLKELGEK